MKTLNRPVEVFISKVNNPNVRNSIFFAPGIIVAMLGITALLAPGLLLAFISFSLLFLGALLSLVAWKFIQLKRRFDKALRLFDGQIMVQGIQVRGVPPQADVEVEPEKKIIFH